LKPDVSILLVTYRCRDEAEACLRSIFETASGTEVEVVVLDNASDDGTAEMVASTFPAARLIASSENLGFALGVNRAAAEATGEFVLLLNPDMGGSFALEPLLLRLASLDGVQAKPRLRPRVARRLGARQRP
jgi:GT2 family glycosyltransferase